MIQCHSFHTYRGVVHNLERYIHLTGAGYRFIVHACRRIGDRGHNCGVCINRIVNGLLIISISLFFHFFADDTLDKFRIHIRYNLCILGGITTCPSILKVKQIGVINGPGYRPIRRGSDTVMLCMNRYRKDLNRGITASIDVFCNQRSLCIPYLCDNLRILPVSRTGLFHRNIGFIRCHGKCCGHFDVFYVKFRVGFWHNKAIGAAIHIGHILFLTVLIRIRRWFHLSILICIIDHLVALSV